MSSVLRHKYNAWQRLITFYTVGKMDASAGIEPGAKESAKTYLVAKQIPQLFQVANIISDVVQLN